jgi:(E)-4-hydroxy-3-methylbut-2-enyl-diphosphate synthase
MRSISIGGAGITKRLTIGGGAPVTIQTMWKEDIAPASIDDGALSRIIAQIEELRALGCDILRFAVPNTESADALLRIAAACDMPLVADIHFDYRLALRCLGAGDKAGNVAVIRINPGNIGARERVEEVVTACRERGAAIRIGVNTGSFPPDIAARVAQGDMTRADALVQTALREADVFESMGFCDYLVSLKASSVAETIDANRAFSALSPVPLHIGVTEAGPLIGGVVKSAIAFSTLLQEGIGDTIRVSLSSSPKNEVIAGYEILSAIGKRSGVKLVSCPRCGRSGFDVHRFVERWQTPLLSIHKDLTVAVMGCSVNGPGEAQHADIGITGTADSAVIFRKGKIVRKCSIENADKEFSAELSTL